MRYEYQVVAAPKKGEKLRGAKTPSDRYAAALATIMNQMGRDGWEYVRSDALPSEERSGWTKRTMVYHHVLVFRRALAETAPAPIATMPEGVTPVVGPARVV